MQELVRKTILKITPYKAGKPIAETKRELGLKKVIKLASNENPLGPSPKALKAIKDNLKEIYRYPDSQGFYLKSKLEAKLGIPADSIILGNGSDEIIDIIIKTFVENDEFILTADTTFLEYEIIGKTNGKKVITCPLNNFKFDLKKMLEKVNCKTKLIFIANPNNPTGTYISKTEFNYFLKKLPKKVLVVLDEAYDTFIDVKDYPTGSDYCERNVITLKTFSKAYGLAGLRIGYAIAKPELIAFMNKVKQPFNVNILAQAAANASLDDAEFLKKTRNIVLEGKKYLYSELKKIGLFYVPSVANFILIDVGQDCVGVFKQLLKQGIIIRDMQQYKLNNFIRVTIGTASENRSFIRALKKILTKN